MNDFILALDPSLRMTGALLVGVDCQVAFARAIPTEPEAKKRRIFAGDDDARRVLEIVAALDELVPGYPAGHVTIAAEQPSGARGSGGHQCTAKDCGGLHVPGIYRTAKAEGLVLAFVTLFARHRGFDLRWVSPRDVKVALLAQPSGSKDEMVAAAKAPLRELGVELDGMAKPKREAIADAWGVLIASGLWKRQGARAMRVGGDGPG